MLSEVERARRSYLSFLFAALGVIGLAHALDRAGFSTRKIFRVKRTEGPEARLARFWRQKQTFGQSGPAAPLLVLTTECFARRAGKLPVSIHEKLGRARQASDKDHRFFAGRTFGRRQRRGDFERRRGVIQQSANALEALFSGGCEPAEVTDALQAFGQDMLKKAMDEAFDGQTQRAQGAGRAVPRGEGNVRAVIGHNAFGAEGGAVNVGGQVFESGFAAADGLDVGHPISKPNAAGDLGEELWMIVLERLFEAGAKPQSQNLLREEIVGIFGAHPAEAIGGKSAAGHDAMDVGMITQVTGPGLEDGEQAEFRAEVFVVARDLLQRTGALADEQRIKVLLAGADERAQFGRHGESDQIIRRRQEPLALAGQPLGGVGMAALRAGAMIAGVVGKMLPPALAPEELASERGGAATENGSNGAPMRRPQARAKLPFIRRPMAAQDFGQWNQRPALKI